MRQSVGVTGRQYLSCRTCLRFANIRSPFLHPNSIPTKDHSRSTRLRSNLHSNKKTYAIDAAMSFDFESQAREKLNQKNKLVIGIVGFGTFGQFLARRFITAGHAVLATSRSPYQDLAKSMGVEYFQDPNDFCEAHPDVVILSTSILSFDHVLSSLPLLRLKRNTLFVDVLSVKEFPRRVLLSKLPPEVDILCTHPMFGPDSGKGSWENLNFMYEKVRIGNPLAPHTSSKTNNTTTTNNNNGVQENQGDRMQRCDAFLDFFAQQGCRMVEMSCEEHDKYAASTQFITHTVGRMLGAMELEHTPIDTKGYQSLLSLVENTTNDSFELYYGLFLYNQSATQELERLEKAFDVVKRQLFSKLHDKLRVQLFPPGDVGSGGGSSNEDVNGQDKINSALEQKK